MRYRIIFALFIICLNAYPAQSIYFIDSQSGNDSNTGKSPENAWASLEKVNSMHFKPGDQILFKAGTTYYGQLEVKGSGSKTSPIIINKYGKGKKPIIHGQGQKLYTILLHNVEYWELNNLEVTNMGPERKAGRRGLIISAENYGDCHHIIIDSLEIHDVMEVWSKRMEAVVLFSGKIAATASKQDL